MSNISGNYSSHAVYVGAIVDFAEEGFDRVSKILAGIPGGVYKAVGSAFKRAASAGKTVAKRAVAEEYTISQGDFLAHTRNINQILKTPSGGGASLSFGYAGHVIPLTNFAASADSDGRVTAQVKRSSGAEPLDHAFFARMGSHTGIFERVGISRFPVRQLYGPATPQMMYANENVMDTIEEKMMETYEKRIEHEITRILNGYGG